MSTTQVHLPMSRLRFGIARADITPPVGIYQRMWGASRHERATGVHRPLFGDVMALAPAGQTAPAMIRATLDLVGLSDDQAEEQAQALAAAAGVPRDHVVITCSHTHSAGGWGPERLNLPGGDLIPGHLKEMMSRMAQACRQAVAGMQEATITYAAGRCNLAQNRDYWDPQYNGYVCGFNPDAPADDTLMLARVTAEDGRLLANVVNYACHATTLAWENSLISPDFAGALREEVERATSAQCVYFQGPCGELGPREGYVGDTAVADRNGRQIAYAALSTLTAMDAPATDFQYQGPVISGATLGTWAHVPASAERRLAAAHFSGGPYTVELPIKPRPDPQELLARKAHWEEQQRSADARGDAVGARDANARAERARRWLARLDSLPQSETLTFHFSVHRLGEGVWVTCGAEPYNLLQRELRRRFPQLAIVISPRGRGSLIGYLLPRERYGLGLYQEEASISAPGCLERLIDAVAEQIERLGE